MSCCKVTVIVLVLLGMTASNGQDTSSGSTSRESTEAAPVCNIIQLPIDGINRDKLFWDNPEGIPINSVTLVNETEFGSCIEDSTFGVDGGGLYTFRCEGFFEVC